MGAAPRGLLLGVCAILMAFAVANGEGEAASVVVGLAKCADCTRKNMNSEAAFKGLQVAIKCKNGNGEYESKAVGELDKSGTFSIPLAADLHGADCFAQLHSSASTPCPGQDPSKIVQLAEEDGTNTFVVVAGKTHYPSAECASATICDHIKKHLHHFHKKPVPPKPQPKPEPKPQPKPEGPEPKPQPKPQPKPEPKPQPAPEYHPPTPACGSPPSSPTPIYHPPAQH